MESYSTFEIEKKLGIPRNRLQQWMDRGVVAPSIEKASGHGTKNRFSRVDLYQIELFQRLVRYGLSRQEAALNSHVAFENISKDGKQYLVMTREILDDPGVCSSGTAMLTTDPPTVSCGADTLVMVVNLLAMKEKVDHKLA